MPSALVFIEYLLCDNKNIGSKFCSLVVVGGCTILKSFLDFQFFNKPSFLASFLLQSQLYNMLPFDYVSQDLEDYQVLQRDLRANNVVVKRIDGGHITLQVGGPYTIDGKHDIYVGDIWVMAGQSNMRGHGYLKDPFRNDTEDQKTVNHVHLYDSTETWRVASDPTHCLSLSKRVVHHTLPDPTVRNPEICQYRGASLGPSFGARYSELKGGMPVGLIASAHGGVSLNDWARPNELNDETYSSTLYGAMMDRIRKVGNRIAGVLWYQGESDTLKEEDAENYGYRFEQWIKVLRNDLESPRLPFVFVQLGAHRLDKPEMIKNWMSVQEQQCMLMRNDDCTVGVASMDCGLDDRLHLSKDGLDILGRRLAVTASLAIEGKAKNVTPLPTSATYEKITHIPGLVEIHTVKLKFDLPSKHFQFSTQGSDVIGFELENQHNVAILRARVEDDMRSIRLYVSGNPILDQTSMAFVSYGMNQKEINLNIGEESTLPVFRNIPVLNKD